MTGRRRKSPPPETPDDLARRVVATVALYVAALVGLRLSGVVLSPPWYGTALFMAGWIGLACGVVANVGYSVWRRWRIRRNG